MFDWKVHHYAAVTDPQTRQKVEKLVNYTPYKMFQRKEQPTILLREGQFVYPDGNPVESVPAEILAECDLMTEAGKKAYGYVPKRGPGRPKVAAE